MPLANIYFGNGTSLSNADALYSDSGLTTCAPDGYYSDGVVTRQQSGCILLPPVNCNCGLQCVVGGTNIATGDPPNSQFNINYTSTSVGAIVVRITISAPRPFSFIAEYNGLFYNKASGNVNGAIQGSVANQPTFIGTAGDIDDCGISTPSYALLTYFNWDGSGFSSYTTAISSSDPAQNAVVSSYDSYIVMVIPKPTSTPTNYSLRIQDICNGQQEVNIHCPQSLPSFMCSNPYTTSVDNCIDLCLNRFYVAGVNGFGSGSGLRLGLYDLVFQDPIGQVPLVDGYYRAVTDSTPHLNPFAPTYPNNNYMQVVNGVIVNIFNEPSCSAVWP